MHGFDEISLIHINKTAATLFELMKTKVGRDMVKLRNVQKERLEEELSGVTFSRKIYHVHLNDSQPLCI